MRRISKVLPLLCTLLLVGLGAFMPRLAALALDRQLENDVTMPENNNISFTLEQAPDFFQTLELFSSRHTQVELSEGNRMKVEDAQAAAVEARMRLSEFDTNYGNPEVTPMLITSRSIPGLSGVFWRCTWSESANTSDVLFTSANSPVVLWLDDQSGQMVSFTGEVEQSTVSAPNTLFPETAVNVSEYCRLCYPVDTVKLALADASNPDGRYTVTLLKSQDGQEKTYSISMRLADGWLYFNMMPF